VWPGQNGSSPNTVVRRVYTDANGNWADTSSFKPQELLAVAHAYKLAYDYHVGLRNESVTTPRNHSADRCSRSALSWSQYR